MARRTCPRADLRTPTSARSIPTSHSNRQESEMLTVERLGGICTNILLIPFYLIHVFNFIPISLVLWHFAIDASHAVVLISMVLLVFVVVLAYVNHIRKHCGGSAAPLSCPITNNLPCRNKQGTSSAARANALCRKSTFSSSLTTIEEVSDEQEKAEEWRADDDDEDDGDENRKGEREQDQGWRKEEEREEEQSGSNNEGAPELAGKGDDDDNVEEEEEEEGEREQEQQSDNEENEEKLEQGENEQANESQEEKQKEAKKAHDDDEEEVDAKHDELKLTALNLAAEFGTPGKAIQEQTNMLPMGTCSHGENRDALSNKNPTSSRLTAAQKRQCRNWKTVIQSSETDHVLDERKPKLLGRCLRRLWRSFVSCGSSSVDE